MNDDAWKLEMKAEIEQLTQERDLWKNAFWEYLDKCNEQWRRGNRYKEALEAAQKCKDDNSSFAPSVTVKPLEWDCEFASVNIPEVYAIYENYEGDFTTYTIWGTGSEKLIEAEFPTLEAAKAAAQADYEARIMAAIQIGPRRATPEALASLQAGEGFATSGAEDRWIEDMQTGVYDDPVSLRHQIIEATDPNFIWGALDNVHDADTTLDDYAAAVSRAIRAALLPVPPSEEVEP